jgi:dipeptidyl-peptidase 4
VLKKSFLRLILTLAVLALAAVGRLIAQHPPTAKSLTVETIAEERERNNSLPRDLSWSPATQRISFIRSLPKLANSRQSGTTDEIWSIDVSTGQQKSLVASDELAAALDIERFQATFRQDDADAAKRMKLQGHAWAPGGHALLLSTATSLVWFDLDTHSPRRLVAGDEEISDPQISPDGRFVSFIRSHALWLVDLPTGATHAFTREGNSDEREGELDWVYSNEFGMLSGYQWSPDSSSIAWIETDDRAVVKYSLRSSDGDGESIVYPKPGGAIPAIHLFVRPVSGGKPLQIDLGNDANLYIPLFEWLPDGKHLAIERLSRDQKALQLLLADAATGTSRVVLAEKDAYWINLGHELHFLKDSRRFLWSSERSGYRHLYLYDLSGQQLAQLTRGNWEVTALNGVDEAAGVVYFTATEASPLERQLYRVNLNGSGFTRITKESGTHEVRFLPAANAFLDTWSDHATAPALSLLHAGGSKIANISDNKPSASDPSALSPLEFLIVKTHMGIDLNAWMMKPPNFDPARKYPVIEYVAGGPGEQIVRDAWGGDLSMWFSLMTQKGYIVFALDNRGSAGHGHIFEEPIHLRFSATEMADQRDGLAYLGSLPWIDETRIGICGWGFGGFLAVHGMLDRPISYKAGFAGSPITDWHLYDAVFAERYLDDPVRHQDGWLASSALDNAKFLHAPLLLAQATLDEKVHLENSLMLLDELLDKGKYADILLFPDRRNLFEDYGARLAMFQRLTDFFVKSL